MLFTRISNKLKPVFFPSQTQIVFFLQLFPVSVFSKFFIYIYIKKSDANLLVIPFKYAIKLIFFFKRFRLYLLKQLGFGV